MKTSQIYLHSAISNNGETPEKSGTGGFVKFILAIFISLISLLCSCEIEVGDPYPTGIIWYGHYGHVYYRHGFGHEEHGHPSHEYHEFHGRHR